MDATLEIRGNFYGEKAFPSLNNMIAEYARHPKKGGAFKDEFMEIAIVFIRQQLRGVKFTKPVVLFYTFGEPERGQQRDRLNIASCADKIIEDALVKCKIIKDDNPVYLKNAYFFYEYGCGEPFVRLHIKEVDEAWLEKADKSLRELENA